MSQIENVSRRRFLTGGIIAAGALVLGVRYYHKLSSGDKVTSSIATLLQRASVSQVCRRLWQLSVTLFFPQPASA